MLIITVSMLQSALLVDTPRETNNKYMSCNSEKYKKLVQWNEFGLF